MSKEMYKLYMNHRLIVVWRQIKCFEAKTRWNSWVFYVPVLPTAARHTKTVWGLQVVLMWEALGGKASPTFWDNLHWCASSHFFLSMLICKNRKKWVTWWAFSKRNNWWLGIGPKLCTQARTDSPLADVVQNLTCRGICSFSFCGN